MDSLSQRSLVTYEMLQQSHVATGYHTTVDSPSLEVKFFLFQDATAVLRGAPFKDIIINLKTTSNS